MTTRSIEQMENMAFAVKIEGLSHRYSDRVALDKLDLDCIEGQLTAILGPNGSGKSTLFRVLSTLLAPQSGRISIFGFDLATETNSVRQRLGVVFQSPSLDRKLTVVENLQHQGHLYGLMGRKLQDRIEYLARNLSIADRISHRVETLSGGLQRRVELAKGLLNCPKLLLLDEPTSGLDPAARNAFWDLVNTTVKIEKTTVLFTTHLIDEAEVGDHLAILDSGRVIIHGTPRELKAEIRKDVVILRSSQLEELARAVRSRYKAKAIVVGSTLRIESNDGTEIMKSLLSEYDGQIESISKSKSDLEDVYFQKTGKKFSNSAL